MSTEVSHLVQNLAALVGLLAVTIVFAAMHDQPHAGEALAAFVGYAAGSRASHPIVSGAAPIVAAGAIAMMMAGCGATAGQIITGAEVVVTGTCEGAEKLCEANDPSCGSGACHIRESVCSILAPASVQITCQN